MRKYPFEGYDVCCAQSSCELWVSIIYDWTDEMKEESILFHYYEQPGFIFKTKHRTIKRKPFARTDDDQTTRHFYHHFYGAQIPLNCWHVVGMKDSNYFTPVYHHQPNLEMEEMNQRKNNNQGTTTNEISC